MGTAGQASQSPLPSAPQPHLNPFPHSTTTWVPKGPQLCPPDYNLWRFLEPTPGDGGGCRLTTPLELAKCLLQEGQVSR